MALLLVLTSPCAIFGWQGFTRAEENVTRNVHYSCVVYNEEGTAVVSCGDDHKITEFANSTPSREIKTSSLRVTQLLLSNSDRVRNRQFALC